MKHACDHCASCLERAKSDTQRDLADCIRMRRQRATEPLDRATPQSTLGPGRSLPVTHIKGLGFGPGGKA